MQPSTINHFGRITVAAALWCLALSVPASASDAYRGLWVGKVTLNYVNEVTVPLDENNVPIAPDPKVPTPTADQAQLRLILHVNGVGQVTLLKDVAILNRVVDNRLGDGTRTVNLGKNPGALAPTDSFVKSDSDVALVTDERLYGGFPPQPAVRIASAVFDFGDSKATDAVNALIQAAVNAAAASVNSTQQDLNTTAGKKAAIDAATTAAEAAANPVAANADVAKAFSQFLIDELDRAKVTAIAGNVSAANAVLSAAATLRDASFYKDARAVDMVNAIVVAVNAVSGAAAKQKAAHNAAATYADLEDQYHRYIASKLFGDMILAGAKAAAVAATTAGATGQLIKDAVHGDPAVSAASAEALRVQVSAYDDTRATDAAKGVIDAMIASAASSLPATAGMRTSIQAAAEQAGRTKLADEVARLKISTQNPSSEYNHFAISTEFKASAATASAAAAEAAVTSRKNDALFTIESLKADATVAAVNGLRGVFGAAARAKRTELALAGRFGPGRGDARLTWDVKRTGGAPLGPPALTGTVILPANHPTNPFRHRRHPDHAVGFDIKRLISFDFDGATTDPLAPAGFGVQRITGVYREEIFGLHKPLGPQPDTAPVGLKVEGRFELNRISLIDTLNAR